MADVTGPTRTLPGAAHCLPPGTMCDAHPKRPAVARIQGETDSFGSELIDCCEECKANIWAAIRTKRNGYCEWCKTIAEDIRDHRDFEEGSSGPVYSVCAGCRAKELQRLECELSYYD
ncbi:hypothetical protein PhaeoP18_01538 [Phaeobacter piscinae]|uniref:hypothetical protein n=1 Tax=Phaeobacter piscinae TaxID=1580596 RepID=UPI000CA0A4B6|nr:hypothetical protein [Phaeobacter piscinae]AUR35812.1 hypothetical protein PhaeoP18_01538 [Phaeobacter piscinae]